jgi:hypothetical protein
VRRKLGLVGFAAGLTAVTLLYRRRAGTRRERVDLYYDDGSMVSLPEGLPDAERLLPVARSILAAAQA